MKRKYRILTINPGNTSTKLALFENDVCIQKINDPVDPDAVRYMYQVLLQLPLRMESIRRFLAQSGLDLSTLDMIVARGGALPGARSGAYGVNTHMLEVLRLKPIVQHAANLAAFIAHELSAQCRTPCMVYDVSSADDADEIMHLTGLPEARREIIGHILNKRMVGWEVAAKLNRDIKECNFIIAHLGSGITVSAHENDRMIDSLADDDGPMGPQRAGRIGTKRMIPLCYSGKYTQEEMIYLTRGGGGLAAHLGTADALDIEKRIENGDEKAKELYWYMAYQVAKGCGEMAAALSGKVDRIILTGPIAYSKMFTDWIAERVGFIAPVEIVPGERELEALAQGGLRVLREEERLHTYTGLPEGFSSLEQLQQAYGE